MIKQILSIFLISLIAVNCQSYDATFSKTALYYVKASYCEKSQITSWNCPACSYNASMTDVVVETSVLHGTQGYVGYNTSQNTIVVAFRGSENVQNWLDNLDFKKTSYAACTGCEVHTGFQNAWQSLETSLMKQFKKLIGAHSGAKVLVTGHSLGGAIAELAAMSIIQAKYTVTNLYTYGTPRIGNEALATYAHGILPKAIRVTHWKDPVPHVPLQSQGFLQVPTEVWYNSGSTSYTLCTMSGVQEDPKCSDSKLDTNVADHTEYLGMYTGCTASAPAPTFKSQAMDAYIDFKMSSYIVQDYLTQNYLN